MTSPSLENPAVGPLGGAWLECFFCGERRAPDMKPTCEACGGTLIARVPTRDPSPRTDAPRLARYQHILPLGDRLVSLGEGGTPLLRLERLFPRAEVYAKLEFVNPTGSFKDRGSAVAVSAAVSLGAEGIVCASTGNNAASVSAYAARAGLPCIVTVPAGTPSAKVLQAKAHGAITVEVEGDFSDAYAMAGRISEAEDGWIDLTSTYLSPYATAAHATILYELAEELHSIGTIIMPVGAGPMLDGIVDGAKKLHEAGLLDRLPVTVGVQGAGCAPIARAFEQGAETVEAWTEPVQGIAGSISDALRGYPDDGTRTLRIARSVEGSIIAVTDDEIRAAMTDLGVQEGIAAEPASAATLAALRRLDLERTAFPAVLVISGHALKDGKAQPEASAPSLKAEEAGAPAAMVAAARARFEARLPKVGHDD